MFDTSSGAQHTHYKLVANWKKRDTQVRAHTGNSGRAC